ncbi:serine/threonine protein phosphatase [Lactococcus lactis]|uniref:serine/threonine protein phosphatase n=1 Tax=Lactococcus lactis TaxID=1358 RepID=UPI0024109688|nr:serine/threonine protein phosphatase [Lactococcus lactis]
MLISIHDRTLERVGFLSNDDSESPDFKDDNFHRYLAQGTSTFDFTVNKIKNGVVQDYVQLLNEHAYFSFQYEGEDFLFDSVIVEEDDDKITFNCLTLNLEMRNEQVKELKNTAAHNIQWYFDQMGLINFAKITLGINEVSSYTRVINYDGEDTKLSRLISVIQNFDGEFEFVTKLKRDGTLDNITLNIYKKNDNGDVQGVGQNRNDVLLSFGDNISGVSRKVEKAQIFNSIYVTGKDGLSWKDSAWSVTNSEGQEEFYKRAGESYAKAPLSAQMFPSQLQSSTGDIFTNKNEATEYTTVNAMWGYALSQLKQYAYPLISYEVTATSNLTVSSTGDGTPLHIGDTVRIQDKNFIDSDGNVGLFLSARVSELEISFTNPTSNKITFSNYIKLKSEVSDDLTARMQEIINANTPYRSDITSTNGLQFKNGTGTTTLGAHIYFGSDDKETTADSYEWSKDGTVVANAQTITVDASGVADKAVYSFKATVAGKVVASQSVTITNVNDGAKGAKGDTGNDGIAGKDGVGLINTTLRYAKSKDGVNKPEGRIVASFTDKFIPARSIIDNLIMTGKQVHLEQGKTYILSAETNGVFTNVHNVEQSNNNATIWIVNPSFSTWDIISDTNTAIGTKYTHNRPTGDYEIRINSYVIDNSIWVKNIVFEDGTWTPNIPVANPGEYLWTRTTWFYSDGTNEQGFSVSKMGDQGIPGPKGADGKTQYTHIAYANSVDGRKDFSTSDSNRAYIGMYIDFNVNDSTTPSDYSWTLVKGADGTQGTPGKPGTDGKTPYFHTAWSYSADGTDRFSTIYPRFNLLKGTRVPSSLPGRNEINQRNLLYWFDNGKNVQNQGLSVGDTLTCTFDWTVTNPTSGTFLVQLNESNWQYLSQTISITSENKSGHSEFSFVVDTNFLSGIANGVQSRIDNLPTDSVLTISNFLFTKGSTATPHMPSASEAKTSDWPSYIGQYTDFTQADSTNPSAYTWSLIRGNDGKDGANGKDGRAGKDGVGIKTTVITYATSSSGTDKPVTGWTSQVPALVKGQYLWTKTVWNYSDGTSESGYTVSYIAKDGNNGNDGIAGKDGTGIKTTNITYAAGTSGTVAPTSGWTSTVPTVAAGSYLWTKTVWAYTDNTSETGYSVAMMGVKGDKGDQGLQGPAGSNGNPGKVVSDTEPTTRFKGLTWKYSGATDLTASDGTVIKPNTEYYYDGTHWIINLIEANQLNVNDLSAISGTYTNGSIKNVTIDGSVTSTILIEKKHILFTFSDSSQNTTNTLELDSQQGYANTFVDSNSGRTRTVQANFQGFFTSDTDGPSAQLTPYGVYVTNGLQTTTVSLGSGINATLAKIGQMCQISINSNSSNVPAGNGVALSGNIPAGWRPAIGTPFEVMMYSGTSFQRPLHITIGTDGKISIVNASASSYWCFGGTTYMLA